MSIVENIKAGVNLYAVLKNIENLVILDDEMKKLTKDWDISIKFRIRKGPVATVSFSKGSCKVAQDDSLSTDVVLFFTSPKHLNNMFDGNGTPIPLKGFTKLGFLDKEFSKVTDKLEYYLKPTPELLKNKTYHEINTIFTLTTAVYALPVVMEFDPKAKLTGSHLTKGSLLINVENGPRQLINTDKSFIEVASDNTLEATCEMQIKDVDIANKFFSGQIDIFSAIAKEDIKIVGQTYLLDSVGLILDRIPIYVS
ncbi:MAG: hypothetical protein KAG14_00260 [Mycoplasmataceae bacterium]|nr:hypothetical protein [Mycoplasmataceae bacterium]